MRLSVVTIDVTDSTNVLHRKPVILYITDVIDRIGLSSSVLSRYIYTSSCERLCSSSMARTRVSDGDGGWRFKFSPSSHESSDPSWNRFLLMHRIALSLPPLLLGFFLCWGFTIAFLCL